MSTSSQEYEIEKQKKEDDYEEEEERIKLEGTCYLDFRVIVPQR